MILHESSVYEKREELFVADGRRSDSAIGIEELHQSEFNRGFVKSGHMHNDQKVDGKHVLKCDMMLTRIAG